MYSRGAACREQGRDADAARCFEKGLEAHPDNTALLNWHGISLLDLGKFTDAMKEERNPRKKASIACWLAVAESKRGNPAAAQKYFEQAKSLDAACVLLECTRSALTQG